MKLLTPYDRDQCCGLGTFTIENFDMGKLSQTLWQKHNIYTITVGIPPVEEGGEGVVGMRVSSSVYTTLRELDVFVDAVSDAVQNRSAS